MLVGALALSSERTCERFDPIRSDLIFGGERSSLWPLRRLIAAAAAAQSTGGRSGALIMIDRRVRTLVLRFNLAADFEASCPSASLRLRKRLWRHLYKLACDSPVAYR